MSVGRLSGGANFSLPCRRLRFGDPVALKPIKCFQFGVPGGGDASAFLTQSLVDDATKGGGFGNAPALGKPLEIPGSFRIKTVSCLDSGYGHTFQRIPFESPVKILGR
jgi:hypothetical protein